MNQLDDFIKKNQQQAEQIQQQAEQVQQLTKVIDKLTNAIAMLKEENQQLKDEIAILKKQKPKPKFPPNKLEGPKNQGTSKKPPPGKEKHPRKKKKTILKIHQVEIINPVSIPNGAVFKGYKYYTVQDIVFQPLNTQYKLGRWQLPDGSYVSGELPKGIHGHYGSELITYILDQYYNCRVTEGLLLEQLRQRGTLISSGQLNNILIHNKDSFHQEKEELLMAGVEAHNQIQADDTGARHKGKSQYTTVIGNEWFSIFSTTPSKSRVNFLKLLQGGKSEYLINEDTVAYLKGLNAPAYLLVSIGLGKESKFTTQQDWEKFLLEQKITRKGSIRLVTEAALCASVIEKGIPRDLGVHADDAGQFDIFIRSLCWIHEERHYRKIVPSNEQIRKDLDQVRDKIWIIYRDLKAYQDNPSESAKQAIDKQFDALFLNLETSSPTLNKRLRMTYEKKEKLLRVLERPDSPLHNNNSERDARSAVIKRKISGGTRSDEGRDCRDTFLSLKQTCIKLGINFITFLKDRMSGAFKIPKLADIIQQRASEPIKKCVKMDKS